MTLAGLGGFDLALKGERHAPWVADIPVSRGVRLMIYTMTKPCPICKQQLTKQKPTESVPCLCGHHIWQG